MRTRKKIPQRRIIWLLYIVGLLIPIVLLALFTWSLLRHSPVGEWKGQALRVSQPVSSQIPSLTLPGGEDSAWYLRLVNTTHPLPEDWAPDLSVIDAFTGEQFDSRAIDALKEMLYAMQDQGLEPLVCSGYRSYASQQEIFQRNVDDALAQGFTQEEAEQQASLWVTPPGCSEHQLALAADIVSKGNQNLDETQDDTPEQRWLHAHCAEYGFVLRYPRDKTELTGVNYEPWHYRYVGETAAREMAAQGLCLEEYEGAW